MNLVEDSYQLGEESKKKNERPGRLGEHLFAQLAGATALDAVQACVNPTHAFCLCLCTHGWDFALTRPPRRW